MSSNWVDQLEIDILKRELEALQEENADLRRKLSEIEEMRKASSPDTKLDNDS